MRGSMAAKAKIMEKSIKIGKKTQKSENN